MYSHEIFNTFQSTNWKSTPDEFYRIMWSSPQIKEYKLNSITDTMHSIYFCTYDGLEGVVWFNNVKN